MIENDIKDFNVIINFLAKQDIKALSKEELIKKYHIEQVDLLIIAGNGIPYIAMEAAKAYKSGIVKKLMIAGGKGHTTQVLRDRVNERYPYADTMDKSEATILAEILEREYAIKAEKIMMDHTSTNCGENARNALQVVRENEYTPKTILLMQDPTMQQRIDACFKKEWRDEKVTFINYAAFIPKLKEENKKFVFTNTNIWGIWEIEHYISLLLGEIPRLHDTCEGYGPNGKKFIVHVDIPENVLMAYDRLKQRYGSYIRR